MGYACWTSRKIIPWLYTGCFWSTLALHTLKGSGEHAPRHVRVPGPSSSSHSSLQIGLFLIKVRGRNKASNPGSCEETLHGAAWQRMQGDGFFFPLLNWEAMPTSAPSFLPSPGPAGFPFELYVDSVPVPATPCGLHKWVTGVLFLS